MNYEIKGENMPVVVCRLSENEQMITESGSMSWMSPNMKMETVSNGGAGAAFGRLFSGERLFVNRYTSLGGTGTIAFASSFPGSIYTFDISSECSMVVQKRGFLASEAGVNLSVFWQKKFGAGLFGGEGFIMQRLSGQGKAFVEIDGSLVEYTLESGQSIIISTGYLAAMSETCQIDIVTVPGVKNMVFGGEGIFNTVVKGPGRVLLQTMPRKAVANALQPYIVKGN